MRPKLVALLVAAALSTGWLLASIVSPPVAELQTLPDAIKRAAPPTRQLDREQPFTEQLHFKLRSAPPAPVPRRNPFLFGQAPRPTREPAGARSAAPVRDALPTPAPTAAGPSLRLSGIGSTATDSGVVRTAVIADGTIVHLVKVGETVMDYVVTDITDDTVTVQNGAGTQWTLRMR